MKPGEKNSLVAYHQGSMRHGPTSVMSHVGALPRREGHATPPPIGAARRWRSMEYVRIGDT